jgi:hypothetical protein
MAEPDNPFQAPRSDPEPPPPSGIFRHSLAALIGTILILYGVLGILGNLSMLFDLARLVNPTPSYLVGLFLIPVLAFITGLLILRRTFRRRDE